MQHAQSCILWALQRQHRREIFPFEFLEKTLSYSALRINSHIFAKYFSRPSFFCGKILTPLVFLRNDSHPHLFFAKKISPSPFFCEMILIPLVFLRKNSNSLRKNSHPTHCGWLLLSGFWPTTNVESVISSLIVSQLSGEHNSLCCCSASCSIEETICHHLHKGMSKKVSGGCSLCCDSSVSWAAGSGVLTAEEGAAAFREQLPSCSARFVMVSRCSFLNVTDPFSRTSTRFL